MSARDKAHSLKGAGAQPEAEQGLRSQETGEECMAMTMKGEVALPADKETVSMHAPVGRCTHDLQNLLPVMK